MGTPRFEKVLEAAARRKGGRKALEALLPAPPASAAKLRRIKDAKALSMMSKGVFRAGFNWQVVDRKWPGIERAMGKFDPEVVATMEAEDVDALLDNVAMIRNRGRIEAVIANARWMLDLRADHGSFARFVAGWPSSNIVALWQEMNRQGSRLGGSTAPYFLRELGKDTFMMTKSVGAALVAHGVIDRPTAGKRNLAAAQAAFNDWHEQSGRPYCALSRIAAMSVDA